MPLYKIITKLNHIPHFYIGTSDAYSKLEELDPKGIYFLYDQWAVLVKDKNLMQTVSIYSNDKPKPVVGANSRLYVNVDNFEEAYEILKKHGFTNTRGDGTIDTKSATAATMVSPSGFRISLIKHIKK